jgi:pentatricopeptide repeat protein
MLSFSANLQLALSAVVVGAVSLAVPHDAFNWIGSCGFVCSDLAIFLSAAVAYWVLLSKRSSSRVVKVKCLQKEQEISTPDEEHTSTMSDIEGTATLHQDEMESTSSTTTGADEQCETVDHVVTLEKLAAERNIKDTLCAFRKIEFSGAALTSAMYNAVLKAWINCGNIQAAEDWMEEVKLSGQADETSFNMLLKTLVKSLALEKCPALIKEMKDIGIQPSIATYNEVLSGFAEGNHFDEGISLLEGMHAESVQPDSFTFNMIMKLLNTSRNTEHSFTRIRQIVQMYDLKAEMVSCLPRLAAVVLQAGDSSKVSYMHEVHIVGSLPRVKAARRALKQDGLFDNQQNPAWPLNGHWETEHGLTVFIEGKMVRWSRQRASKLHFVGADRRACTLTVYGELARGRLVLPALVPGAAKTLQWDNGDVWHAYAERSMGPIALFSQTMTKIAHDVTQDTAYRARSDAVLKCVSKEVFGIPSILEDMIKQFLGSDLHYFHVRFENKWNPSSMDMHEQEADICASISRRHPRVGLRHCWAEQSVQCCGQRTLVNGYEVDEESFTRHIKAVRMA